VSLQGRDFLEESDFTAAELDSLLRRAAELKAQRTNRTEVPLLVGKHIVLIFEKTSTRTRIAFEVAAAQQGARTTILESGSSQIGHKESIADTARVLARIYDAIEYRGSDHANLETLAQASDVPVYNGLTDRWHPTQMLADFMTMREYAATDRLSYAYMGDARYNMGNSLLVMGAIMGADVRIVAPRALWPQDGIVSLARERAEASGATITLTEDQADGVAGVDFIHTDVWVSMGEAPEAWEERVDLLRPYRVDSRLLALADNPGVRFMHCLPAYHDQRTSIGRQVAERFGLVDGVEVSDEVFESAASIVFDQAENRMHSIKALLVATLAEDDGHRSDD
jgi:ornithine carbamoyltransferase